MAEAVASQPEGAFLFVTFEPSAERLREQIEEFEDLVETMLKRFERMEIENGELRAERDRLREEVKRLKGE